MTVKKRKVVQGRPRVSPEKKLGVKLTVSFTQADWELIEARTAASGLNAADTIREAVRTLLGALTPDDWREIEEAAADLRVTPTEVIQRRVRQGAKLRQTGKQSNMIRRASNGE